MSLWLCHGATLLCSAGTAPSQLKVSPSRSCMLSSKPAATTVDHIPMQNIQPFGNCNLQNTPSGPPPCMPVTSNPWSSPVFTIKLDQHYALTQGCTLQCTIGGMIQAIEAGQYTAVADNIHSGQSITKVHDNNMIVSKAENMNITLQGTAAIENIPDAHEISSKIAALLEAEDKQSQRTMAPTKVVQNQLGSSASYDIQQPSTSASPPVNPSATSTTPLASEDKNRQGVFYLPFVSKDMVDMVVASHLQRQKKNKSLYKVIVKNEIERDQFNSFCKALDDEKRTITTDFSSLYIQYKNNGLTQKEIATAMGDELFLKKHQSCDSVKFDIKREKNNGLTMAEIRTKIGKDLYLKTSRFVLRCDKECEIIKYMNIIVNNQDPLQTELAKLSPKHNKLYILGHGIPNEPALFADENGDAGHVTVFDLAKQLRNGGLPPAFSDFRTHACYSADRRQPLSFQAKELAKTSQKKSSLLSKNIKQPMAQALQTALYKEGFTQAEVTGYHGAARINYSDHKENIIQDKTGHQLEMKRSSKVKHIFKSP